MFILVFVAATTIGTAISRWPVPIYDDVAEAISWGRHLELGYYKHPPLFGWIAGLWFSVLPANEFTAYLLGAGTPASACWGSGSSPGGFSKAAADLPPLRSSYYRHSGR